MYWKEKEKKVLEDIKKRILVLDISLFTTGTICNIIQETENTNEYCLATKDKSYIFRCLSDINIISIDKKILKDCTRRKSESLYGCLKILKRKVLSHSELFIAHNVTDQNTPLIKCRIKNKKCVIDYNNNLVMGEKDYNDLYAPDYFYQMSEDEINKMIKSYELIGNTLDKITFLNTYNELYNDAIRVEKQLKK